MTATINGESRQLPARLTVAQLLDELKIEKTGIAVAVNERVVRNAGFEEHRLQDGDVVEIIRAVAGG